MANPWEKDDPLVEEGHPWEKDDQVVGETVGPVMGTVRAFNEGFLGDIPRKLGAAAAAAATPIDEYFGLHDPRYSHASSFSQRYQEDLEREREKERVFKEQHPVTTGVANVGGRAAGIIGPTRLGGAFWGAPGAIGAGAAAGGGEAYLHDENIPVGVATGAASAALPIAGRYLTTAPKAVSPWVAKNFPGFVETEREAAPWVQEAGRMAKSVVGNKYVKAAGVGAAASAGYQMAKDMGVPDWIANLGEDAIHWWVGSKIWGH